MKKILFIYLFSLLSIGLMKSQYCITGLGGFCTSAPISRVSIVGTTFDDSTQCVTASGQAYSFIAPSANTSTTLVKGQTYTINVLTVAGAPINVRAYLDYNKDGDWTDAGEEIIICTTCVGPVYSASFTVPFSAVTDSTRLRVRTRAGTIADACQSIGSGSTHDYTVYLDAGVPCSGTPTAGTISIPDSSLCLNTPINIVNTGFTVGSGVTFQWFFNGSPLVGDTNANYSGLVTAAGTYYCEVSCNAGAPVQTNSISVTINPVNLCYCNSSSTNPADEDIGQVSLGSFTNGSGCTPTNPNPAANSTGYSDFKTALPPITILKGITTPLSVCVINFGASLYNTVVKVFIDINGDGTFKDSLNSVTSTGEVFLAQSLLNTASTRTASTGLIIPSSVPDGLYAMRVIANETSVINAVTPCGTYTWGETEDYMLDVQTPVGCTGTPLAGAASTADTTVCNGTIVTFNVTGETQAAGISYQWQINGVNILGATNPSYTDTVTAGDVYQCVITCANTAASATSTAVTMSINPFSVCYCSITSTSTFGTDIGNVTIGSFTNGTASPIIGNVGAIATYTNFSSLPPIALLSGIPNNIQITGITSSTFVNGTVINGRVFIDYNHDGAYDPITELAVTGTGNYTGVNGSIISGNPLIPSSALTGVTGMRVMLYETSVSNPCIAPAFSGGETEDYLVDIQAAVSCSGTPVAGSTQSNDTLVCPGQSITLTLNGAGAGSGITYQWYANGALSPNDTLPTLTAIVNVPTSYYCVLTCANGGATDQSTALAITFDTPTNCLCASSSTSTADEDIGQVSFGSLINGLGCTPVSGNPNANSTGYSNFKSTLPPTTIFKGVPTPISVCVINAGGSLFTASVKVFIDINNDGVFKDSLNSATPTGEVFVAQVLANTATTRTATALVTLPSSAVSDTVVMRVIANETGTLSSVTPCGTYTWGETEDYLLVLDVSTACFGAPNAGSVASTDTTVCPLTSFTLSLNGASVGSDFTYQWQANGVNLLNDTLPILTTSISANTIYTCIITCTASGQSSTATALTVTVNSVALCFCASGSTSTADEDIGQVTVGGFTNGSGCTPTSSNTNATSTGYSDFKTALPPITVLRNTSTPMDVCVINAGTTLYSTGVKVFLDTNANGVFEPSELFISGQLANTATTRTLSGSLLVTNTVADTIAMRIVANETALANVDACGTYTWGETEDYLVAIVNPLPCTGVPAAVTLSSSVLNVCGDPFTLTSDTIVPALGITYNWTANGTPISNTNPSYTTTQSATTAYQLTITCANGGSVASNIVTVIQNAPSNCYCFTGLGGFCSSVPISGFTVAVKSGPSFLPTTLDNQNNGCTTGVGAQAYTAYPISSGQYAILAPLDTFQISVTTIGAPIEVKVWTDWNRDGVWNNTNELAVICTTGCVIGTNSALFFVDPSVNVGDTVNMRVRTRSGNIADACQSIGSGETEDYVCVIGANTILTIGKANSKIETKVSIFPNPTSGILNYEIPKSAKQATITVSDLLGRNVLKANANNTSKSINLSGFKNGTYLVSINVDGKVFQSKVVLNQ